MGHFRGWNILIGLIWSQTENERIFLQTFTFIPIMLQGGPVSQAEIKRKLDDLSKQIDEIDLKIESFIKHGYHAHIPAWQAAKIELQK